MLKCQILYLQYTEALHELRLPFEWPKMAATCFDSFAAFPPVALVVSRLLIFMKIIIQYLSHLPRKFLHFDKYFIRITVEMPFRSLEIYRIVAFYRCSNLVLFRGTEIFRASWSGQVV
jgi:hypothetical protein